MKTSTVDSRRLAPSWLALALLVLGCSSSSPTRAGGGSFDAASDAPSATLDAASDASTVVDSGPLVGGSGATCNATAPAAGSGPTITIDGASSGRIFDFLGGLSGGGGTSRLLYDYPPAQQAEVLDYLFKPDFGASLQLLKVEIGADTDTTNGAEASHQRSSTDRNYHRGYEWWLMQQAKARNPDIKLYGLEWGAPGWFNGGFYSQDNINYIVDWIQHAQSVYGLTIDYVGGWNESGYYKPWLEALKAALVSAGLSTRLVAADDYGTWTVAADMNGDPTFAAAVDVVGAHYPCQAQSTDCGSTPNLADALSSGKPLWASEEGSGPFDDGAIAMARAYNRHYIQAKVTASINWSVVGSWYSNLPYGGVDGLLFANQPWSGYYAVDREIWATAHTTQFVRPGWQYLDSGSALVSGVGSHVALKSPNGQDWSAVIETADTGSTTVFQVVETGGLLAGPVHVWSTDLSSLTTDGWFIEQPDVTPVDCAFSFTALPNHLYTLTTTSGQGKGATTPPAPGPLPLPYADDFDGYTVGAMPNIPKYFSTVEGAFEVENCAAGRAGQCLQQEILTSPIGWGSAALPKPVTLVGDPSWANYRASVDILLQESGSVDLVGRVFAQNQRGGGVEGYHLRVSDAGSWSLLTEDASANDTTLASGTIAFSVGSWHTLALDFSGAEITAFFDGSTLAAVSDATYGSGNVALSASQWNNAQFDNFQVATNAATNVTDAGGSTGARPTAVACSAKPPAAASTGSSLITDFSSVNGDGGVGSSANFGQFSASGSVFGGGSYAYPGMGPGIDSLANPTVGTYCTTLGSQNSFSATAVPGTGLVLSGTVATFSGVGLYLYACVDASSFHGVQFTIAGDVGNEELGDAGSGGVDGGTSDTITFSVSMSADITTAAGAGDTCTLGGSCAAPSYSFTVPSEPTTIQVPWSALTGGAPVFVLDPTQIAGMQWALPWPCVSNPTPYTTRITISDIAFF